MKKKLYTLISVFVLMAFLSIVSVYAEDSQELFQKGNGAYAAGDYKTAMMYYEKALKEDSEFAPAYYQLGLAHKAVGTDLAEVAWYLKAAVDLNPSFAEAHDHLGKIYYGMGHFDKAEKHALKAISLKPDLLSSKFSLGWIYLLGKSQPKKAIPYFQEMVAKTDIPYAHFGLGMAYFMSNDSAKVLEIITLLKNRRENTLAEQLEAMVRGNRYVPPVASQPLVNPKPIPEKKSMLIKAVPEAEEQQESPEVSSSTEGDFGTTRIRLRGRLFGADDQQNTETQSEDNSPYNKPQQASPSFSSSTSSSSTGSSSQSQPSSGVDRVRQLQRKGSGY